MLRLFLVGKSAGIHCIIDTLTGPFAVAGTNVRSTVGYSGMPGHPPTS